MTVLVAYASAHGATKDIAKEIAGRLELVGLDVDLRPVDEVDDVDRYDAVVLGSAVHGMAWLPAATALVRDHAAALAARPTWCFSVSSVGDTTTFFGDRAGRWIKARRGAVSPKIAAATAPAHPRDHRNFAGVIRRDHYDPVGRLVMRLFGGRFGDHRDWIDIDTWADAIADQLARRAASAAPAPSAPTT